MHDETVRTEYRVSGSKKYYLLDGEKYLVISNPDPNTMPFYGYRGWSYDRRFFYEYASTDTGGKLYKNTNTDSSEAFILKTSSEEEFLLIRNDSPLADPYKYQIEDFNLVIFANYAFDRAEPYASVLAAHIKGDGAKMTDPEKLYDCEIGLTHMTFECKRVPGLRYTISLLWDEKMTYVYCRRNKSLVSFDFGVSFDEVFGTANEAS